jgi:integrase
MRKTLTDRTLKALRPAPAGKRYTVWDGIVPNFGARVTDKGHISFVIMKHLNRKLIRRCLGDYPGISLEAARHLAREALEDIARGIDPKARQEARQREEDRRRNDTFAAMAEQFIAKHVKKLRTADEVEAAIRREFISRWGSRPIADITRRDVVEMLDEVVERGTPYAAHHMLAFLRKLYNWAIARSIYGLEHSPCDRLKPSEVIGKPTPRVRTLTDGELRLVWAAAGKAGYPFGPLIRLLCLTGQRRSEVAEMSWHEVDLAKALWVIPAERMKAAAPHVVPISPVAVGLLETLPNWTRGDFVFTTTSGERPVSGFGKAKERLDKTIVESMCELATRSGEDPKKVRLEPWRLHDIRRTVRTHLSALPVQDIVRELVIGHTKPGLHKVYDQHAYLDEKRHALDLWAKRLMSIVQPARNVNIVQLRAAAERK